MNRDDLIGIVYPLNPELILSNRPVPSELCADCHEVVPAEGHILCDECDAALNKELDSHSDTYSGDGAPANADPFTLEEAIAAVDLQRAQAARRGNYECASDLQMVGDFLRGLNK